MRIIHTPILIAGGGSTGLSLAADLGWRGTDCMLVEPRTTPNPHPRANALGNRSMEFYRRWGIDKQLIGAGVPSSFPAAYYWVSKLNGKQIHSLHLPGHDEIEAIPNKQDMDPYEEIHWSPYLKNIIGQNLIEQILRNYVDSLGTVQKEYGWELLDFEETDSLVKAIIQNTETQERREVHCQYLVGCDGGRSVVRKKLTYPMQGRSGLANFISIYFHAPTLMQEHAFGPANIYFPIHKDHRGFLLNWDTGTHWTYHLILEEGVDWESINPQQVIYDLLGKKLDNLRVISTQPWIAHALTAKHYRSQLGRAFLAGDSAHLFTPTGGLGMNTGVADAIDLSWKLSAALSGWGGEQLLASYEVERHPIGVRNTSEAADNFDRLFSVMQHGDELEQDNQAGQALRLQLEQELKNQEKLLKSSGVLLGYRYENSPICIPDGSPATLDHPQKYTPTARPGHRAPHIWLDNQESILDRLGPWFNLICFGGEQDTQDLGKIFSEKHVPLKIIAIDSPKARQLYGNRKYVIIRPDMMVAWRGDELQNPLDIFQKITGNH